MKSVKLLLQLLLPLTVIGIAVGITSAMYQNRPEVEEEVTVAPPPLVRFMEAQPEDYQHFITSQGTVRPAQETTLVAEVGGRILEVSPRFNEGDFVSKGEVLIRIDSRDYELEITAAKSAIAQGEVRRATEEQQAEIAIAEWKELGEGDPPPLLAREPQLAEVDASIKAAEANLQAARLRLSRTRIEAPYNARIRNTMVDVGQFVTPGTPLATIYSTDVAEVVLPIPTEDLDFVQLPEDFVGDATSDSEGPMVTLSARLGSRPATWQGRITRTLGEIDERSRMLQAVAEVKEPLRRREESQPPMKMGLFVNAQIQGKSAQSVFKLPRYAVRPDNTVLIVTDENSITIRPVNVLRSVGKEVIVSEGLQAGERICLSTMEVVVEGMKVRTDSAPAQAQASGEPSSRS